MRPDRLLPSPGSCFLDLVEGGQLPDQWHYRGGYQSWSLNCQRGGVSALISSMSVRLYRRVAGHELVGSRARDRRTCPWSCCDIAHSLAPKENLRAPHGMMRVIRELLSAACRRYRGSRATIRMRAMVIAQRAARWARSELPFAWLFAAQGEFLLSHNARKYLNLLRQNAGHTLTDPHSEKSHGHPGRMAFGAPGASTAPPEAADSTRRQRHRARHPSK